MKIKSVSKEVTYYVEMDEDVDDPEFLWYRTDEHFENWQVLVGDVWERCLNNLELNEAFIQYHKDLGPKKDILT